MHTTEASGGGSLVVRREKGGHVDVRIVYARDFMLQVRTVFILKKIFIQQLGAPSA